MSKVVTSDMAEDLLHRQLENWNVASRNYAALKDVREKTVIVDGIPFKVQFNPARITSTSAKIDAQSVAQRKCFLCQANRPLEQKWIDFNGNYQVLVNPFPIFPKHLTIPLLTHADQRIAAHFSDMLDLTISLERFVVFYNGPRCGASAPDHLHFQAGNKGFLPIEESVKTLPHNIILKEQETQVYTFENDPRNPLIIETTNKKHALEFFETIYNQLLPVPDEEPMMNIITWMDAGRWIICIFPRVKHRPSCYFADGEDNIMISPGAVDIGGMFITPLEKDFEKMDSTHIHDILTEVCIKSNDIKLLINGLNATCV